MKTYLKPELSVDHIIQNTNISSVVEYHNCWVCTDAYSSTRGIPSENKYGIQEGQSVTWECTFGYTPVEQQDPDTAASLGTSCAWYE